MEAVPVLRGGDRTTPPPQATRRRRRSQTTDQPTVAAEAVDRADARARSERRSGRGQPLADERTDVDRTLILVKPDAFARGLTGEIIHASRTRA